MGEKFHGGTAALKLFVESVPHLRASEVFKHSCRRVAFLIVGRGGPKLHATLRPIPGCELQIDTYYAAPPEAGGDPEETHTVGFERASAGTAGIRTFFACPKCQKLTDVIYLHRNIWACRKCQGLNYRSQYTSKEEKEKVEYDKLWMERRNGRPRHHRHATWEAKMARLQQLESRPDISRPLRKDQSRLTYKTVYHLSEFDPEE